MGVVFFLQQLHCSNKKKRITLHLILRIAFTKFCGSSMVLDHSTPFFLLNLIAIHAGVGQIFQMDRMAVKTINRCSWQWELSPLLSELFCLCLQCFLVFFLRCSSPSPSNIHHCTRAVGRRSKPPAHTASPPTLTACCWPLTTALLTLMEWRGVAQRASIHRKK